MTVDEKPKKKRIRKKVPSRAPAYVKSVLPENVKIKENFPSLLVKHFGLVGRACAESGISRETYYIWKRSDPDWAIRCTDAIALANDAAGDFVESKLYELIGALNPTAIIFYCKSRLRDRGYVEKKDFDVESASGIVEALAPLLKKHEREY